MAEPSWEDWRCEAQDYVVQGQYVVVLTRYRGRGKGSGAIVDKEGPTLEDTVTARRSSS